MIITLQTSNLIVRASFMHQHPNKVPLRHEECLLCALHTFGLCIRDSSKFPDFGTLSLALLFCVQRLDCRNGSEQSRPCR